MPIIRRSDCVPLPVVLCPVVAVVMLESRVARCVHCVEIVAWLLLDSPVASCVHCVENVACQATFSTQCTHLATPTLQHHKSYNRTENYRQWNAVGSPDDGHKDARNMLRYYWLPINHYLLHLVGLTFTYSKCVIFQEGFLKVLKCYNFLWVQRRHNCSPAASFANCVMTLYVLKVHLQNVFLHQ